MSPPTCSARQHAQPRLASSPPLVGTPGPASLPFPFLFLFSALHLSNHRTPFGPLQNSSIPLIRTFPSWNAAYDYDNCRLGFDESPMIVDVCSPTGGRRGVVGWGWGGTGWRRAGRLGRDMRWCERGCCAVSGACAPSACPAAAGKAYLQTCLARLPAAVMFIHPICTKTKKLVLSRQRMWFLDEGALRCRACCAACSCHTLRDSVHACVRRPDPLPPCPLTPPGCVPANITAGTLARCKPLQWRQPHVEARVYDCAPRTLEQLMPSYVGLPELVQYRAGNLTVALAEAAAAKPQR